MLGTGPVLGRAFLPEEDREGGAKVVILSDGLWRSRFGADPAIVGRAIRLDRLAVPGHRRAAARLRPSRRRWAAARVSLFVPAAFPAELLANRGDHETNLVAPAAAGRVASRKRRRSCGPSPSGWRTTSRTRTATSAPRRSPLDRDVTRDVRGSLLLLLGAVAAVLAIACLNVANLQVVRALSRHRELAVCGALGASRGRLVSGLLIESLLVAGLGGLAGLGLASVLLAA